MRQKRISSTLNSSSDEGAINLTPLIDVVFVVLIMFILVAPMLELDKVKLAQGRAKETSESLNSSSVVIHVQQNNSVWINKREVSKDNLSPILKALYQKNPKIVPQLYHDRKAYFETYQTVKNAVELAGFEELDVVLEPTR